MSKRMWNNIPFVEMDNRKGKGGALRNGFKVLDRLWSKGLTPKDLKFHFYFTWFAQTNGYVTAMARITGFHRNKILYVFKALVGTPKTYRFRAKWNSLCKKKPVWPFPLMVLELYKFAGGRPRLNIPENRVLVDFWLTGFPYKLLRSHYVLWSFRRGMGWDEVIKRLRFNLRTLHRIRFAAVKRGSPAWKWLQPLNPSIGDWYPKGMKGRPRIEK